MKRPFALVMMLAALGADCTLRNDEAPPLLGPSELATSMSLAARPDVLPTDGRSQALITITANDAYGLPLRGLSLRAETRLDGVVVTLGRVSPQSIVTDNSGRALLTYTAPTIHGDRDTGTIVDVVVTPLGANFANAIGRTVRIRLIPASP